MVLAWYWTGAAIMGAILVLVAAGVPVAFALGAVAAAGTVLFVGPGALANLAYVGFARAASHTFIVVPLFLLMAAIISYSGVAEGLFNAAHRWLASVPGSLAASTIVACAGFAAITGSSPATAATVGAFAVPEMRRHGYDKRFACGAVASGGTLGVLLPPSIGMVIFGIITETSVGKLFLAGVVPGLLVALLLVAHVVLVSRLSPRHPGGPPAIRAAFGWSERFGSLRGLWGFIALFVLVIGSLYAGAATPSEAAGLGAGGALLLTLANRRFTFGRLGLALLRAVETTSMIVLLLVGGFAISYLVAALGIGQALADLLVHLHLSRWIVVVLLDLLLQFLGGLIDPGGMIVITMPILFPALVRMGFSPLWIGVNVGMCVEIAMLTPPVALNLFILKGVVPADTELTDILVGAAPFIVTLFVGLILVIVFPDLALWLPSHAL